MTYDDDYPSCESTYATLRIYKDDLEPEALSARLGVDPSRSQRKGDVGHGAVTRVGGWFLSSEGQVESRDVQRHIAWILECLEGKQSLFKELQDEGYEMDVFCFWASAHGHGGPQLSSELMERLSSFRLTVGFDIYF